jgi:hypothetical protein
VTNLRLRNLLLPVALAVIAAVLVGYYVVSYRDSVKNGAGLVKVLVASRAAATSRPRWSPAAPS